MSLGTPRINNMKLSSIRRDLVYEAVMTDLALLGIIPKEVVEQLTSKQMSKALKLPSALEEAAENPVSFGDTFEHTTYNEEE